VEISARNQIKGTVISIKHGSVMAEVGVEFDGQVITSTITMGSLERLKLCVGDRVVAIIKASDVIIAK
jgi:molybdopterin-binding protein